MYIQFTYTREKRYVNIYLYQDHTLQVRGGGFKLPCAHSDTTRAIIFKY